MGSEDNNALAKCPNSGLQLATGSYLQVASGQSPFFDMKHCCIIK